MPDDIKLSLGVETQNTSKEIKELTKSVVTDLGKIKSASKSAIDFGRIDTSAIRSAMRQFEALQAEQKKTIKEQEVLAKHPWLNTKNIETSVRDIKTVASELERVRELSSRALQFDSGGKVAQVRSEVEAIYNSIKQSETARRAEIKESEILAKMEQEQALLTERRALVEQDVVKLRKLTVAAKTDTSSYRNTEAEIQRVSTAIIDGEAKIQGYATQLRVLANIREVSPKFDAQPIDNATYKVSGLADKVNELNAVSLQAIEGNVAELQTKAEATNSVFEEGKQVLAEYAEFLDSGKSLSFADASDGAVHFADALYNLETIINGTYDAEAQLYHVGNSSILFADETKAAELLADAIRTIRDTLSETRKESITPTIDLDTAIEKIEELDERLSLAQDNLAETTQNLRELLGMSDEEFKSLISDARTDTSRDVFYDVPEAKDLVEEANYYAQEIQGIQKEYNSLDSSGAVEQVRAFQDELASENKSGFRGQDINLDFSDRIATAKDELGNMTELAGEYSARLGEIPEAVGTASSSVDSLNTSTQGVVESAEEVRDIFAEINGVSEPSTESQKTQEPQSITEYVQRINELEAELDKLQQREADVLSGNVTVSDDAFVNLSQNIANTENELEATREGLRAYADEITGVAQKERELEANEAISDAKTRAVDMLANAMERVGAVADSMNRRIVAGFKSILNGIKNIVSQIKSKLIGALNNVSRSADKAFSSRNLKRSLTTLLKYTIGVRSLYFAFRKLRNMVKQGLNNLVQYDSANNQTNTAITELRTSLLYLKNAWGAAFAPVINAVYPILVQLMDMLAAVGNAIARFVAALTGQASVLQAVRVGAGDYAQSLAGAGGSAKKAADEQKKLNDRLAAFDDLNVLGKDKEDEDDKSPSGGGGGGYNPNVNDMFTRIDTPMSDLAKLLKEAWATGDGFNLGEFIGTQLLNSLLDLRAWLQGEGREQFMKIAEIIGSFIDGFISVDGLAEALFGAFADGFDLAMEMINTIITPERFYKIGEFIVNGLREAVPIIVPKIGETIGNILHSAISLGFGAIQTMNEAREQFDENGKLLVDENGDPIMLSGWQEWGKSFAKAINNFFDEMGAISEETGLTGWQELGQGLSDGAIGIMDFIISAINDLDPEDIKNAIKQFLEKIDWEEIKAKGKELWDTVWKFLGDTFPDINVEGIKGAIENIVIVFTDLVDDIDWAEVKNAFDNILNFIANIDASEVESAARAIAGLVVAIEAIGGLTKIMGVLGMLTKVFSVLGNVFEMVGVLDLAGIGGLASGTGGALAGGGILTGIAGIIVGIYGFIEGIKGIYNETIGAFGEGWTFGDWFKTTFLEGLLGGGAIAGMIDNIGSFFDQDWDFSGKLHEFYEQFPRPLDLIAELMPTADERQQKYEEWGGYLADGFDIISGKIADKLATFKEDINWEEFINGVKGLGADFVAGIDYWKDDPAGAFEESILLIKDTFSTNWGIFTADVSEKLLQFSEDSGLADFIAGIVDTWDSVAQGFRNGINVVIDVLNGFLDGIASMINGASDLLGSFEVTNPLTGSSTTIGIPHVNFATIPYLAQGAVIPPNKEFMAVLGDQSHGTNIEAPLDTIRQAVGEEFAPYSEAIVNAIAQVVQAVNNKNLVIGDREIGKANARYESQQALIRGTML